MVAYLRFSVIPIVTWLARLYQMNFQIRDFIEYRRYTFFIPADYKKGVDKFEIQLPLW